MGISSGYEAYRLSFQLSPIILTRGIASYIPGGMLPIIAITESLSFLQGLLSGGDVIGDQFFANFEPLPGSRIISQRLGKYPFANQSVAANAVIPQPKNVSMRMVCPAKDEAGYAVKLATMLALQATLEQHNAAGGTYTVATPSFFFTNCVMLDMYDTSASDSKQPQNTWQIDFERPLLTLQDAENVQNGLMQQITNGISVGQAPSITGLANTIGNVLSLATLSTLTAATNPAGSGTATSLVGGTPA